MAPFKINTSAFTIDNLKKEATVSSLKDRSKSLSDRYSSPSSSSTGYRPGAAASTSAAEPRRTITPAAPSYRDLPPPARHAGPSVAAATTNATAAAPPLPPARTPSREVVQQHEPQHSANVDVDWQNISSADKNALFSVLDGVSRTVVHGLGMPGRSARPAARDTQVSKPLTRSTTRSCQFFGGKAPASALVVPRNADVVAPPLAPLPTQPTATHHRSSRSQQASASAPPQPQQWARPGQTTQEMSYPPPCHSSSHAHDLANQFSRSAPPFAEAWFTADSPQPPALVGRRDMTWTSSWQQLGTQKTLVGAALFADLSVCWWKVEWDMNDERRPGFLSGGSVRRSARYMDTPAEFGADELWDACSTYGEQVAQFAEEAERRGLPIAHGECWDLASEGLASVMGLPAPIPSIARTHGHLLFSGSASGKDFRRDQRGHWRGVG